MLDHVSLQVDDVAASRAFYRVLLAPLGLLPLDVGPAVGFEGASGAPFWIGPAAGRGRREVHLAFRADDRRTVDAFFQAARQLHAEVLHRPRVFPEYGPHYYACFVRDPDGHNVEAVCRAGGDDAAGTPR